MSRFTNRGIGRTLHRLQLRVALLVVSSVLLSTAAAAQRQRPRVGGGGEQGDGGRRAVLERQFRAQGEQLVRERLNLTDAQVAQLRDVNSRLDGRRRALTQQERSARVALRDEIARGGSADQARVAQLMRDARDLQQQRIQLQQEEQQQLSSFLTPVQQAQFYGLQAQLRAKMRELRAQQGGTTNQL